MIIYQKIIRHWREEHSKKIENLVSGSSLSYHAQGSEKKSDISGRDGLSGAFASIKKLIGEVQMYPACILPDDKPYPFVA